MIKKSRNLRKVYVKLPGNQTAVHYKKKRPKQGQCSTCGKTISGTIRELPYKLKKIAKTKKRPERPYPHLCSACMRKKIISEARENV